MVLATIAVACLIVIAWRTRHRGSGRELHKIEVTVPEPVTLPGGSWRFIVSGDSRNCGDVVMPTIAIQAAQFAPSFYWHLGDLRAIYKIDEDMAFEAANHGQVLTCENYERLAWSDYYSDRALCLTSQLRGRQFGPSDIAEDATFHERV